MEDLNDGISSNEDDELASPSIPRRVLRPKGRVVLRSLRQGNALTEMSTQAVFRRTVVNHPPLSNNALNVRGVRFLAQGDK